MRRKFVLGAKKLTNRFCLRITYFHNINAPLLTNTETWSVAFFAFGCIIKNERYQTPLRLRRYACAANGIHGGTIYISREVADRLEGRLRVTSLGDSIKLKGKAEGFEVLIMEEIL